MSRFDRKRQGCEPSDTRLKKSRLVVNREESSRVDSRPSPELEVRHVPPFLKHRCHMCPFQTHRHADMERHRLRHVASVFTCRLCNMPFRGKPCLTRHERKVHDLGTVDDSKRKSCELCPYTTLHSSDIARHRKKHATTEFSCEICNYPIASKPMMQAHMLKTHGFFDGMLNIKSDRKHRRKCETNKTKSKKTPEDRVDEETKANNSDHDHRKDHGASTQQEILKRKWKKTTEDRFSARNNDTRTSRAGNKAENESHKAEHTRGRPNENESPEHKVNKTDNKQAVVNEDGFLTMRTTDECHKKSGRSEVAPDRTKRYGESQKEDKQRRQRLWCVKFKSDVRAATDSLSHDSVKSNLSSATLDTSPSSTSFSYSDDIEIAEDVGETESMGKEDCTYEYETMTIFLEDNTTAKAMRCLKCIYLTSSMDLFKEHMDTHKQCSYECGQCRMPFILEASLEKHIKSAHDVSDSEDTNSATSRESLVESVDSKKSETSIENVDEEKYDCEKEINCAFCKFTTKSYVELKEHIDAHVIDNKERETDGHGEDAPQDEVQECDDEDEQANDIIHDSTVAYDDSSDTHGKDLSVEENIDITENNTVGNDDKNITEPVIDAEKSVTDVTTTETVEHPQNNEREVKHQENLTLTGRLDKETFRKTKKLYTKLSTDGGFLYECLICTDNNMFPNAKGIWLHFKRHHKKLRKRICSSCPYCCKPFPRLKKA